MVDLSKLEKVVTQEDLDKEKAKHDAALYMTSTDWYVLRKFETGKEIPEDVVTKRSDAREVLSI